MRVLIADPDKRLRRKLRRLVEAQGCEVVAEAGSGHEMEEQAARWRPDAVVVTASVDGLGTGHHLRAALRHSKAVVLTAAAPELDLPLALELGVQAYLVANQEVEPVVELPRRENGKPAPSLALPASTIRILPADEDSNGDDPLTRREQEVLDLMARGITSNRELAGGLRVSENTVKFHVRNILDKLRLKDRAQAVGHALRATARRDPESHAEEVDADRGRADHGQVAGSGARAGAG